MNFQQLVDMLYPRQVNVRIRSVEERNPRLPRSLEILICEFGCVVSLAEVEDKYLYPLLQAACNQWQGVSTYTNRNFVNEYEIAQLVYEEPADLFKRVHYAMCIYVNWDVCRWCDYKRVSTRSYLQHRVNFLSCMCECMSLIDEFGEDDVQLWKARVVVWCQIRDLEPPANCLPPAFN